MALWRKKKGLMRAPKYVATFDPMEREVLGEYAAMVAEALIQRCRTAPKDDLAELTGMPSGHKEPPQDPSLARLLPDFEREGDEEYEGDNALLRSLHENDICRAKLENLQVIAYALGPDGGVSVTASEEEAQAWLYGLNDIRLYIASGELTGGEAMEQDRENVLNWLAYNEESLLNAMMGA
ncbi:DUF2017 domain-containing protein [Corynebacterium sp.]|uniref:DUF2017 domain-containing protein n=1 Tax=Corynebacterium sp. TaxID=1720 RepID=UPI0026DCE104|nr:DUF2017 domain-containing protein [Corynebacterium sp.]MDO5076224.1 DUF2017 domain-containing protein [Corynebacterium sp.]